MSAPLAKSNQIDWNSKMFISKKVTRRGPAERGENRSMWAESWFLWFPFELSYNLCIIFDNFQAGINCHHESKNTILTQKPKA